VVVESHDDFPGVEISIAGGVGEMVRGPQADSSLLLYTNGGLEQPIANWASTKERVWQTRAVSWGWRKKVYPVAGTVRGHSSEIPGPWTPHT